MSVIMYVHVHACSALISLRHVPLFAPCAQVQASSSKTFEWHHYTNYVVPS